MRRPRVIAFDLDDVLNCLVESWLRVYNHRYDDNLQTNEILGWDIAKYATRCSPEQFEAILTPSLYSRILPAVNANAALQLAHDSLGADIYIVTSYGRGTYKDTMPAKVKWVEKHLPIGLVRDIVFLNDKSRFRCDYLIDDGIHNLDSGGEFHPILISRPWNRGQGYEHIIPTYHDAYEAVQHIVRRERKDT